MLWCRHCSTFTISIFFCFITPFRVLSKNTCRVWFWILVAYVKRLKPSVNFNPTFMGLFYPNFERINSFKYLILNDKTILIHSFTRKNRFPMVICFKKNIIKTVISKFIKSRYYLFLSCFSRTNPYPF